MSNRYVTDVAIIGGGPAGCMAALGALIADPSLSVTIIEPIASGRHRIGEALLTGTVMTLTDAGIEKEIADAGYHRKNGASYVWGKSRDPWYVNYPANDVDDYSDHFRDDRGRYSIHVPRHEYDRHLQEITAKRGVKFIRKFANSVSVSEDDNGVTVRSIGLADGSNVVARRYIDCTGQTSFLGRRVTKRLPIGYPRIARYAYTSSLDWEKASSLGLDIHRTNIISDKSGWIWAIHLGEAGGNLTSFGFVSTPDVLSKLTMDNCVEAFPSAAMFGMRPEDGYLEPKTFDGKVANQFYGHPDYSYSCTELHGPNWSLCGDAAVFIDPILSQGVTLATHYGFLRGKAAAAEINEVDNANENVTAHYRNEASIMSDVVMQWYGNNKSMEDWCMTTVAKAKLHYGEDMDPEKAFRWITNLENIRDEYDPYPRAEREKIIYNLRGDDPVEDEEAQCISPSP